MKRPPNAKFDLDSYLIKLFGLILRISPERLTFSMIARATQIPRTNLYYFFGSSREKMLEEALSRGITKVMRLRRFGNYQSANNWKEFEVKRLQRGIRVILRYPFGPHFYLKYRTQSNYVGQAIRQTESLYIEHLQKAWKHFYQYEIEPERLRIYTFMKIGLLMGFAQEPGCWKRGEAKTIRLKATKIFCELSHLLLQKEDQTNSNQ